MSIGDYLKIKDVETYNKLLKFCNYTPKKPIPLGDSIESLMKHDSYKRVNRRMRQKT